MQTQKSVVNGVDLDRLGRLVGEVKGNPGAGLATFRVRTAWEGGLASETTAASWDLGGETKRRGFSFRSDEPLELCGRGTSANPQELLMGAINACMMATFVAVCAIRGIELDTLEFRMEGTLDLRGFLAIDSSVPAGYESVSFVARVAGAGSKEDFESVMDAVRATSPNYFNTVQPVAMRTRVELA